MSFLDFTEIAEANIASGDQDQFEIFTGRFLQVLGYRIRVWPSHGPTR